MLEGLDSCTWQQQQTVEAMDPFDKMPERNHIYWNQIISGLAEVGDQKNMML
jgi:hypothetical protein